jgi:hypothetical protein
VFAGAKFQKGHGIGGLLSGFFKSILPAIGKQVLPLLKSGAKSIGKQVLKRGTSVLKDALAGKNIKSSLRDHAREGMSTLVSSAIAKVSGKKRTHLPDPVPATVPSKKRKKKRLRTRNSRRRDIFDD